MSDQQFKDALESAKRGPHDDTDVALIWAAERILELEAELAATEKAWDVQRGKLEQHVKDIEALRDDCKFLLSWAPKDCPKSLDPTFYFTLSYEGDLGLQERVDKIRAALLKESGDE